MPRGRWPLVLATVWTVLAACSCSAGGPPAAARHTPSRSAESAPTPSVTEGIIFRCVSIQAPESLAISPDGRYIAALSNAFSTVTIWTLDGSLLSRHDSPSAVSIRWSPDSSHLLIWASGQGALAQGVNAPTPTLPSAAQEMFGAPSGQDVAVETSESGMPVVSDWALASGQVNVVVRNAHLLGWNADSIVYAKDRQVFEQRPGIATATQLGTSQQALAAADFDSPTSPDGQALLVRYGENGSAAITRSGVRPLPPAAGPPLWVPPHSLIEYNQSVGLSLFDVVAGAGGGAVGSAAGVPQAVSDGWVAWQSDADVGVTLLNSSAAPTEKPAPVAGTVSSLGGGTFLLHGSGMSYEFASQEVALRSAPSCPPTSGG